MPHPLRLARPTDPFLRFNVDDRLVVDYRVDGDHVGLVRPGRRGGEVWISVLGDDVDRAVALIDELSNGREVDGIHVHDAVYEELPERLRIPDPGHWSIWSIVPAQASDALGEWAESAVDLTGGDPRIDPLLAHSESAYVFADSSVVSRWVGVVAGDELLAVGGESTIADGVPHLVSICTAPEVRGRGLARAVTARLVQGAFARVGPAVAEPEVCLEMYAGNEPAARLYRRIGFRELGRYRSGFLPGRSG